MHWYIYAIAGPFVWALVNQIDKYLVERFYSKQEKNITIQNQPGSLVLFSSLFGGVVALLIGILVPGVFNVPLKAIFLLILAGFCTVAWIMCYLYALQEDEVSTIAPLFLIQIAFAYILGVGIFNETLGMEKLFAIAGVFVGAVILSLNFKNKEIKFKKRILVLMVSASVLEVIASALFKYVAVGENFWLSQFWQYMGFAVSGIFIFFSIASFRKDFIQKIRSSGIPIFSLNIGSEALTVIGNLCVNTALLLAPVAIVFTFVSFQAVYVFLLSILMTKLRVSGLQEDMSKEIIIPKVIAIIIMTIASSFLF